MEIRTWEGHNNVSRERRYIIKSRDFQCLLLWLQWTVGNPSAHLYQGRFNSRQQQVRSVGCLPQSLKVIKSAAQWLVHIKLFEGPVDKMASHHTMELKVKDFCNWAWHHATTGIHWGSDKLNRKFSNCFDCSEIWRLLWRHRPLIFIAVHTTTGTRVPTAPNSCRKGGVMPVLTSWTRTHPGYVGKHWRHLLHRLAQVANRHTKTPSPQCGSLCSHLNTKRTHQQMVPLPFRKGATAERSCKDTMQTSQPNESRNRASIHSQWWRVFELQGEEFWCYDFVSISNGFFELCLQLRACRFQKHGQLQSTAKSYGELYAFRGRTHLLRIGTTVSKLPICRRDPSSSAMAIILQSLLFFSRTGTRQMAARSRRAVVVENICAPTEGVLKFGIQLKLSLPTSAQSLLANSKGRRSDMWGIWTTQANRDEDEREYGLPWTVLQEIVTSKARPALAFDEKRRIKLL